MSIEVISFDGDDTLWDFRTMMRRGTEAVVSAIRYYGEEDFAHLDYAYMVKRQKAYLSAQDVQSVDYLAARRQLFCNILQEEGHPKPAEFADQLIEIYREARDSRFELFPDAHQTLAALQARYRLAYITNGKTYPDQVGLGQYFEVVVNCDDHLGIRKPRPEVFEHTAQQAGIKLGQMLHVGDNLLADVGGAIWAKAHGGIWFNPHGEQNETKIRPTSEIQNLSDLLTLLD